MLIAIWPIIFVILGLLMWAFLSGKAATAGFVIFCCGMGALALTMSTDTYQFGAPHHQKK